MPTAVLDLDIEHLPPVIEVTAHYRRAFVLLRWHGHPIGQIQLPVCDRRVDRVRLDEIVSTRASHVLWKHWLRDRLALDPIAPIATPAATVAVCTRDRPDDLRRCLDALARLPDDGQEVVVVDNCPRTDATLHLVRAHPRVRYVREPRPGLDVARNRALAEASHPIVAFTDDDAAPDPGWLRGLLRSFDHPLIAATTGLTLPLELETEAQELFEEHCSFARGFARRRFDGTTTDPSIAGRIGGGVNMAVRRSAVAEVGGFDEALDAGTVTRSGGDHEMFSRLLRGGFYVVYEPDALCWHRHRRTHAELRATFYGYGVGVYAGGRGLVLAGGF